MSTTSWKKIGVASANSCTNSEATSTCVERPPVAQDRRPEPAEAEGVGVDPRPAEPAGDEDRQPGRKRFGLLERNLLRRARQGIDQANLALVGGDRQNRETAVLQLDDRRIGNGAEALGVARRG